MNNLSYLVDLLAYQENKPLLFTQLFFWIFFLLVLFVYSFIYKRNRLRIAFLFAASLYFYYKTGGYFLTMLIFTCIVDYSLGIFIDKAKKKLYRKVLITLSLLSNLGILAYFKYSYFFIDLINQVFQTKFQVVNVFARWSNEFMGSHFSISTILLPIGISFFTFQSLSYTIDIYRRKLKPVRTFIDFAFFVSFFPQLVAGPIVRAADFLPQLNKKYKLSSEEMGHAFFLILNGLIKKMLIADFLSINFVDRVFDNPGLYSGFENLMAVYGYAMQIYCDFSGYTDIAIGLALLMGYRLVINFNSPYKAENITEFWRRWHISLSSWLRDYLYISLGGNRKGKIRTYVNLMLTMLIGGLWHGANLRFIIWGGLHGVGLVIHKLWIGLIGKAKPANRLLRFLGVFLTFHFVCFAWIFFRATSMENVSAIVYQITHNFNPQLIPQMISGYRMVFALIGFAYVVHWLPSSFKENYRGKFIRMPLFEKVLAAVIIIFIIYQFKADVLQPFIYFQF